MAVVRIGFVILILILMSSSYVYFMAPSQSDPANAVIAFAIQIVFNFATYIGLGGYLVGLIDRDQYMLSRIVAIIGNLFTTGLRVYFIASGGSQFASEWIHILYALACIALSLFIALREADQ